MKLNNQVIVHKLGNKYVAYDNNKSVLHEFNQVGYLIINAVEKGFSKKKIIKEIIGQFKVEENQAIEDLNKFLIELEKKDLLTL